MPTKYYSLILNTLQYTQAFPLTLNKNFLACFHFLTFLFIMCMILFCQYCFTPENDRLGRNDRRVQSLLLKNVTIQTAFVRYNVASSNVHQQ